MFSDLMNFAALIAALAAAAAAIFTLMQARSARHSVETQLFIAFSDRYSDPKMSESLRHLINWYKLNPIGFAEKWHRSFIENDETAVKLDDARRIVSICFVDIALLYKNGQTNKRLANALAERFGLDVFYEICDTMYEQLYTNNQYTDYKFILKDIRRSYAVDGVFQPQGMQE